MIILINSSKTMKSAPVAGPSQAPELLDCAVRLDALLKGKSPAELRKLMHLSEKLAAETHALIGRWSTDPEAQTLAIDAFQGDIYRGLLAHTLSDNDRAHANKVLRILSGLYGVLRPFDRIAPYRLELMYGLKGDGFGNLYDFWGSRVADTLPKTGPIFDLASEEYSKLVRPFVEPERVVEPEFLTCATADAEPAFVAVHAKVARGAMARWMVMNRIRSGEELRAFPLMGYRYDPERSTPAEPTFIRTGPFSLVTYKGD